MGTWLRVSQYQSEARRPDPGAGLELRQLNRSRGGLSVEKVRGGQSSWCAGWGSDPGGRGVLWGESGLGKQQNWQCENREGLPFNRGRVVRQRAVCEAGGVFCFAGGSLKGEVCKVGDRRW